MSDKIYKEKYLKYKQKYIELQKFLFGSGNSNNSLPNNKPFKASNSSLKKQLLKKNGQTQADADSMAKIMASFEGDPQKILAPSKTNCVVLIGQHIQLHVGQIKFTQSSVSNNFTDGSRVSNYSIKSNIKKITDHVTTSHGGVILNINDIARILVISPNKMTLQCICYDNVYYSCNNRRLCMLKVLYEKGLYDGLINVIIVNNCSHDNECINVNCDDVQINMGFERGCKCSELYQKQII
jgi:hypothetical protein